jgi:hypothetical protein
MNNGTALAASIALFALLAAGCGRPEVPDARDAARAYAEALRRGDHDAVFRMMTRESQQALGKQGTQRLLADAKVELKKQASALLEQGTRVEAKAVYRLEDGESAELVLADDGFRVAAAGAFPAAARTPAQALTVLRQALARRSYPALVRVLSSETQSALETEVRGLVEGLEHAETLEIKVEGDTATVDVKSGHRIHLKREAGAWRVDDVE